MRRRRSSIRPSSARVYLGDVCESLCPTDEGGEMSPIISRGFRGRRDDAPSDRVPPGQYVTRDFPVLSAGPTPHTPLDQWTFALDGLVKSQASWTWQQFTNLSA